MKLPFHNEEHFLRQQFSQWERTTATDSKLK